MKRRLKRLEKRMDYREYCKFITSHSKYDITNGKSSWLYGTVVEEEDNRKTAIYDGVRVNINHSQFIDVIYSKKYVKLLENLKEHPDADVKELVKLISNKG